MNPENRNNPDYPKISAAMDLLRAELNKDLPDVTGMKISVIKKKTPRLTIYADFSEIISVNDEFEIVLFYQTLDFVGHFIVLTALKNHDEMDCSKDIKVFYDVIKLIMLKRCYSCEKEISPETRVSHICIRTIGLKTARSDKQG